MGAHHELCVSLHLHDLCGLLLDHVELLLPDELLVGEHLELVRVLQGAARLRVECRPHWGGALHHLCRCWVGVNRRGGGRGSGMLNMVWNFCMDST